MGQSPDGDSVGENNVGIEFHQGKLLFTDYVIAKSDLRTTAPTKIAVANSVLLCVRAPVGKVNITDREICIGRGLCSVHPLVNMPVDYFFRLLETCEGEFVVQAAGSTFAAITGAVVWNKTIYLPPIAEQRRIISVIETAFEQLDEIAANLN
jgi:type I restriction enzyme S subunit